MASKLTIGDMVFNANPTTGEGNRVDQDPFDSQKPSSRGDGVTSVEESGGTNAPEKKTETGFDFTTRVDREPKEISVSVFVPMGRISKLQSLRRSQTPVPASFGDIALDKAVIDSLSISNTAEQTSHVEANIDLREIRTFSTGTTTIVTTAGSSGAEDEQSDETQTQDPELTDDAPDNSDGDGGNVVGQAFGDAADAIGGFVGGLV